MAFTYDLDTAVGIVRLLIADTDRTNHDFEDDELTALLTLAATTHDDSTAQRFVAAAHALNALAANKSRLTVRLSRGSVSEDLTGLAQSLRQHAALLMAQAEEVSGPLAAFVSPSWERFSYTENLDRDREDATGVTDVFAAP